MTGAFQLSCGDAIDWLGELAAASVSLVVLDPGVPGRARRAKKGEPSIPAFAESRLPALLYQVQRVLARDRLCWWVTDTAQGFKAARVAERLGFAIGAPIVWDRGDGPGARLGFILPLTRGRARSPGAELVTAHRSEDAPTALPELLCHALIEAGSQPDEVVVDPFMGTGALGLAALTLGRSYLGNDLAPLADAVRVRLGKLGEDRATLAAELATRPARNGVHAHHALGPRDGVGDGVRATSQLTIFGDGAELR